MTLRRAVVASALMLAVWCWCGPALAVRLPLRPPKSRPPVAQAEGAEPALLQLDGSAAPAGPRFVESHTADTAHSRHAVRGGVRAKARVGDGWAYNFDEPPKTLQPPWAKAPEMGEFDLPAPPPAWTPPPPPPMGMYGEERAFPPPPSPPPPPPPPIPPPPPKAPEGADESFVERSGNARGGSAGAKGKRKPALPKGAAPPFDANSPFASLVGLPFAMPDGAKDADAFGGNGGAPGADPAVDFSRRESYPPPAGALLPGAMGGYADGDRGARASNALPPPAPAPAMASAPRPSGAADVPPTPDANYVFPGLPAVPPLNSPNMPTPPQRADAPSAGWDPDEAVAHVPGAEDAARW